MTNINPIRFGIAGNQYFKQETKEDLAKNNGKENTAEEKHGKQVDSKEVLGYLAAQNADIIPAKAKRTVDVSKYVNAEQSARIEDFMKAFEADYIFASKIAKEEFGDISDETAGKLALSFINSSYKV